MGMIPSKRQWKAWSLPSKLTAIGALVGMLALILWVSDKSIGLTITILARPSLDVATSISSGAVDITIRNPGLLNSSVDNIVLSYPVPGRITEVTALDPTGGTQVEATALGGDSPDWLQNQLLLKISVTARRFVASYRVSFLPAEKRATLRPTKDDLRTNLDRYHLTCTWHGYGAVGRIDEWRSIEDDVITKAPNITVSGFQLTHEHSGSKSVPRRPL